MSDNIKMEHENFCFVDLTKEQLTERQMSVINCIYIKNTIKSIIDSKCDSNGNYEVSEISKPALEELGLLVARLESIYVELKLDKAETQCTEALQTISKAITQYEKLDTDEFSPKFHYLFQFRLSNVYTFDHDGIATELI